MVLVYCMEGVRAWRKRKSRCCTFVYRVVGVWKRTERCIYSLLYIAGSTITDQ